MGAARAVVLAALAVLVAGTTPLGAQRRRPGDVERAPRPQAAITFVGGVAPYDLEGTGTAGFGAVRFDIPASRILIIEPGISVLPFRNSLDQHITYLLTEVSVQVQPPVRLVRPYVGGGIGFTEYLSGRGRSFVTLHAVAGVRAPVGGGWGIRLEGRARSIDPFKGESVDLGFGVSRVLGRR